MSPDNRMMESVAWAIQHARDGLDRRAASEIAEDALLGQWGVHRVQECRHCQKREKIALLDRPPGKDYVEDIKYGEASFKRGKATAYRMAALLVENGLGGPKRMSRLHFGTGQSRLRQTRMSWNEYSAPAGSKSRDDDRDLRTGGAHPCARRPEMPSVL